MDVQDIGRVAVIGAGLMGHGIALEFAAAGYEVGLHDVSRQKLDEALALIEKNLAVVAELGLISREQAASAPARIRASVELHEAAREADVVIEAVAENLQVKLDVFRALDACCPQRTIFASNSSSLMPSQMAPATTRADRFLVAHYFNPPHLLPLVELVRGPQTSDATLETMHALYRKIGKEPAIARREAPGFIGNRLQAALLREALSIVENGIATPQDVDIVIKCGFGRRLAAAGVFEIFDIAGWDLLQAVMTNLIPDIESSRQIPKAIGAQVVSGKLGLKTGEGVYRWTPESANALRERIAKSLAASAKLSAATSPG
jgi:3-hydroxybutyryl-CoA dehydrogenase